MKHLAVLHAMAHIYHQKLASGLLVTLLQEACDISTSSETRSDPGFCLKYPLSQIVILLFEVQVMFG